MRVKDREIAKRSLGMQSRASNVRLLQIAAYTSWTKRKLDEGVSDVLIAHLDSTAIWLVPEDISTFDVKEFGEMLSDLQEVLV